MDYEAECLEDAQIALSHIHGELDEVLIKTCEINKIGNELHYSKKKDLLEKMAVITDNYKEQIDKLLRQYKL